MHKPQVKLGYRRTACEVGPPVPPFLSAMRTQKACAYLSTCVHRAAVAARAGCLLLYRVRCIVERAQRANRDTFPLRARAVKKEFSSKAKPFWVEFQDAAGNITDTVMKAGDDLRQDQVSFPTQHYDAKRPLAGVLIAKAKTSNSVDLPSHTSELRAREKLCS